MVFIKLLGDPLLQGPGGPITGRAAYKRRLAVLAILAVARGRPVGRERLIGLLWPEHPADAARHTLSEALYVLRKELGDTLFLSVGDEVALNPAAASSDVARFEEAVEAGRFHEAAALYGGPLLDGFYVSGAAEFERWVDGERERLARAFARALSDAAQAETDPLRAAEWWRRLAAHDPYSSRAVLRLAQALDAAGERAAALRAAGAHAAFLRRELEVEPDDELGELVERLRAEPPRTPLPARPPSAAESPSAPDLSALALPDAVLPSVPPDAVSTSVPPPVARDPVPSSPAAGTSAFAARPGDAGQPPAGGTPPALARDAGAGKGRGWWRRAGRMAVGAAATAGALAGLALALGSGRAPAPPPEPRYDPRRVAVLYFDDYSPGGELGYLANGLTEMLIHELSQAEALDVVSRNGVKPYRDHAVPFAAMSADLRAGTVVEGSIQRSGERVRVTVQLIDANTQAHLDSRTVEHPLGDLFALQDAVADEVSGFLRSRVGREVKLSELRGHRGDPRALERVLRAGTAREDARQMARSPHPRDVQAALRTLSAADTLLDEAAALDPRWAAPVLLRGWVALDGARLLRGPAQARAVHEALARAEEGMRLEPGSVDGRELRGTALWLRVFGDPGGARGQPWLAQAERDLRAVVARAPDRASAWATLSQLLRVGGDLAEAEVAARRAREEDAYLEVPDVGMDRLYRAAFALEDFARARYWCGEGRRHFSADYRFRDCELALLARDPASPARPDSAWALVAALDAMDPPAGAAAAGRPYAAPFRRMMAAAVLARAGLGDSARAVSGRVGRAVAPDPDLRASYLWDEAYLQVRLGNAPRAAVLLDSLLQMRPALTGYVAREPAFSALPRR